MNYKQTQQFNERKVMVLMLLANEPLDLDEMGTLIPIKQIEKKLGVKKAALYRCLHSLENDGMIICTHHGYQTGINSKRWLITDKADEILRNQAYICKYNEITNTFYKSLNCKRKVNVITFNSDYKENPLRNVSEDGNIRVYILINYIQNIINLNNKYNKIQTISNLRIENDKIKGRAYNALCLTKSGKKQHYMKSDKRLLRTDFLSFVVLSDYKEIFDIKSQIPRLTYILQGGNYDDIADFYTIEGLNIKGLTKEATRELVKWFFMNTYFDKSEKAGAWHKCRRFLFDKRNKANIQDPEYKEIAKEWIYRDFGAVWNHFRTLIKPIGSEIFLWTSLWEQLIIKEAREQLGVHIVNVYDGFYYNDESIKDELNKIAAETSIEVRRLYNELKNKENNK
jgi:DNA-binding PadR family transcriptional regulator/uncharacterized protein YutD